MNSFLMVIFYILTGAILGFFYFGGLWLGLRNIGKVTHPYLLIIISFVIRIIVLVVIMFVILQQSWSGLIFTLIGFFAIRMILMSILKPHKKVSFPKIENNN